MDPGALVRSMGCRCSVRLYGWIFGDAIVIVREKNGKSNKVNDARNHFIYLSEMINDPSKIRQ
jgi:hypothetical protein